MPELSKVLAPASENSQVTFESATSSPGPSNSSTDVFEGLKSTAPISSGKVWDRPWKEIVTFTTGPSIAEALNTIGDGVVVPMAGMTILPLEKVNTVAWDTAHAAAMAQIANNLKFSSKNKRASANRSYDNHSRQFVGPLNIRSRISAGSNFTRISRA